MFLEITMTALSKYTDVGERMGFVYDSVDLMSEWKMQADQLLCSVQFDAIYWRPC